MKTCRSNLSDFIGGTSGTYSRDVGLPGLERPVATVILPRAPHLKPVRMVLRRDASIDLMHDQGAWLLGKLWRDQEGLGFTLVGRDGTFRLWHVRSDNGLRGKLREVVLESGWMLVDEGRAAA